MNPVWVEFPNIPWGSVGWRMGWGEVYWGTWIKWYSELSVCEKDEYKNKWPENSDWEGFYNFIENGTTPPWIVKEKEKTEASGKPPEEHENVITERYRVKWLLTRYLKFCENFSGETDEYCGRILYEEPNGQKWVAYLLKPAGIRLERETKRGLPLKVEN